MLCSSLDREIVLIIDEVDKNSDNQIFLSFLGLLRHKYLEQRQGSCEGVIDGVQHPV